MKNVIIIVIMLALGAGGAFIYLKSRGSGNAHEHGTATNATAADLLHGGATAHANAPKCTKHNIPEAICAFCDPSLIESLGFCRGHNVAEAFCTRCSPVLIAAFKAENDWCDEHTIPESQCDLCKGSQEGS